MVTEQKLSTCSSSNAGQPDTLRMMIQRPLISCSMHKAMPLLRGTLFSVPARRWNTTAAAQTAPTASSTSSCQLGSTRETREERTAATACTTATVTLYE